MGDRAARCRHDPFSVYDTRPLSSGVLQWGNAWWMIDTNSRA